MQKTNDSKKDVDKLTTKYSQCPKAFFPLLSKKHESQIN